VLSIPSGDKVSISCADGFVMSAEECSKGVYFEVVPDTKEASFVRLIIPLVMHTLNFIRSPSPENWQKTGSLLMKMHFLCFVRLEC